MKRVLKKVWDIGSAIAVTLMVLCAVFLVGSRLLGYQVFAVVSGSMEPEYSVGDLIYVKEVDVNTIRVGDPITFVLNENLVVATHRVAAIDAESKHFYTKGDANDIQDSDPVHFNNVIGIPKFSIPLLGYVSNFIQNPPGTYITLAVGLALILLVFLPDLIGKKKECEDDLLSADVQRACKTCRYYWADGDLPHPVCTRHKFHFEREHDPCADYDAAK